MTVREIKTLSLQELVNKDTKIPNEECSYEIIPTKSSQARSQISILISLRERKWHKRRSKSQISVPLWAAYGNRYVEWSAVGRRRAWASDHTRRVNILTERWLAGRVSSEGLLVRAEDAGRRRSERGSWQSSEALPV